MTPTPRVRVLPVLRDRSLLVIDRTGPLPATQIEALIRATNTGVTTGTLVFPFEVDLPEDEPTVGVELTAEEIDAIQTAAGTLLAADSAEWGAVAETLRFLVMRNAAGIS